MRTQEIFRQIEFIIPLFDTDAWSGFTNQPDGDAVEILSDSASDVGKCTIFGTNKTTGAFKYETVTLTGATAVTTTETDWGNIYGMFLGDIYGKNIAAAVGTITFREASGNQAINTLTAGDISDGLVAFDFKGKDITIVQVSGNLYLKNNGAATTANGYPFSSGEKFSFMTPTAGSLISLIADTSAATSKIIVWN